MAGPKAGHAQMPIVEEVVDNHKSQNSVPIQVPTRQEAASLITHVNKLTGENFVVSVMFRGRKLMKIIDSTLSRKIYENEEEWFDKDAVYQSMHYHLGHGS